MFFGWFDAIFSFIFPILFLLFIGMFFFALISNLRTWNKNNHSPRLTVPATVVAKRTDVSHSSSANAGDMSGAHGYDTSTFTSSCCPESPVPASGAAGQNSDSGWSFQRLP